VKYMHRPRIALADLLILVAMAALGMAVLRATLAYTGGWYYRHVPAPHSHWAGPLDPLPCYLFNALFNGVPLLVVASLSVVVLSLRGRRYSILRLSHQPGFLLCLAAVTSSVSTIVVQDGAFWLQGYVGVSSEVIVNGIVPNAGYMVLGCWMALIFVGRGRPAPSWLDRAGYVLGASWVMLLILDSARFILEGARVM
jgi:hypothetical protein